MIDLNLMLGPPKEKVQTLEEFVKYIRGIYIQSELMRSMDIIADFLPELPNDPTISALHNSVIRRYRTIAQANSHFLKEQLEYLVQYERRLRTRNPMGIAGFLKGLEERLSNISQEDSFYLARKPRSLKMSDVVIDAPRIRPEGGIIDTDYKLQRLSIDLTT